VIRRCGFIQNPRLDAAEEFILRDLKFLMRLLVNRPKCYWIWLLEESKPRLPTDRQQALSRQELELVTKMLAKDCQNFHGWTYRRFVIEQLESLGYVPNHSDHDIDKGTMPDSSSLIEQEFNYTSNIIRSDLSNYPAWHYRSKLIPALLSSRKATEEERGRFLENGKSPLILTISTTIALADK
jgi:geranylgeranyl transferase type-2 subunit alpha